MSNNKDFDTIMREITGGLIGDSEKDMVYLQTKCEEYKNHEMSTEIVRACGRLMYDLMTDEQKEALGSAISKDSLGTETALDEIRFNIYKKDYDKALKMIDDLTRKVEALDMYHDDQVSEYHTFNEFFEEILYHHIYKPEKELRQAQIPYTEIYYLYGSLLFEMKRFEEARQMLQKGLRWNPMDFSITAEYIETYKAEGNMELFFEKTKEAFKIAIHTPQVARCFRNLGYYFVEVEKYSEAVAALLLSKNYEEDAQQVQSELYYINQVTGGIKTPSVEEAKQYSEQYGFPMGADKEILHLAYNYGKHYLDAGQKEPARYFLSILYELTDDEEIKKMLDSI